MSPPTTGIPASATDATPSWRELLRVVRPWLGDGAPALLTPDGLRSEWPRWPSRSDQRRFIRAELAITRHREFSAGIGETRNGFKCVSLLSG